MFVQGLGIPGGIGLFDEDEDFVLFSQEKWNSRTLLLSPSSIIISQRTRRDCSRTCEVSAATCIQATIDVQRTLSLSQPQWSLLTYTLPIFSSQEPLSHAEILLEIWTILWWPLDCQSMSNSTITSTEVHSLAWQRKLEQDLYHSGIKDRKDSRIWSIRW